MRVMDSGRRFAVPHRVTEGCALDSDSDRGKKGGVRVRTPPMPAEWCRLLLDDPDLDFGLHVGVQANAHAVDAKRLDRLVELDLALFDVQRTERPRQYDTDAEARVTALRALLHQWAGKAGRWPNWNGSPTRSPVWLV